MFRKLRPRSIYDVMAAIACFGVLAGGTAYAADTIGSSDIIDNEIRTADVRNDTLSGGGLGSIDIANGEMTTNEIRDDSQPFGGLFHQDLAAGSVRSSEIEDFSIGNGDLTTGSVDTRAVSDNSLTGADIQDGTLDAADVVDVETTFRGNIGMVPANTCVERPVTGLPVRSDHLVLTPHAESDNNVLTYSAKLRAAAQEMIIQVCNPRPNAIDGGITWFNLLAFEDAASGLD